MRRMYSLEQLKNVADSRVQALVEGGTLDNAKPIYCHPISILDTNGAEPKRLTCLIFNNDNTPFTLTSLKKFIDDLAVATTNKGRIMVSGGVKVSATNVCIASYITKGGDSVYYITGINAIDGSTSILGDADFNVVFPSGTTTLDDGVNKIN